MITAAPNACRPLYPIVRSILAGLLVLFLAGAGPAPSKDAARSPLQTVEAFHEGLAKAARSASGKSFGLRKAAFAPVVSAYYDLPFMTRIAAGSYWDGLSEAERGELAATFADLTVSNYASRFRAYSGQGFTVIGEEAAPQGRILVRAQIMRKSGEKLNISYLLARTSAPDRWSIVDVWLKNTVSELALRRAEFSPVLRAQGGAALIEGLRSKIAALPKEDAPGTTQAN